MSPVTSGFAAILGSGSREFQRISDVNLAAFPCQRYNFPLAVGVSGRRRPLEWVTRSCDALRNLKFFAHEVEPVPHARRDNVVIEIVERRVDIVASARPITVADEDIGARL